MTTAKAYAAPSATEPLEPTTIERRAVGPNDVLIDIAYSGICHSDIHTVSGEWGRVPYPLAPGHEIVGTVAEVGGDVTKHKVGDRVGVGCMVNSCRECDNCKAGSEQYCTNGNVMTWTSTLWGTEAPRCAWPFPYAPDDGREALDAPAELYRVIRGDFYSGADGDRPWERYGSPQDMRERVVGVRLARSV